MKGAGRQNPGTQAVPGFFCAVFPGLFVIFPFFSYARRTRFATRRTFDRTLANRTMTTTAHETTETRSSRRTTETRRGIPNPAISLRAVVLASVLAACAPLKTNGGAFAAEADGTAPAKSSEPAHEADTTIEPSQPMRTETLLRPQAETASEEGWKFPLPAEKIAGTAEKPPKKPESAEMGPKPSVPVVSPSVPMTDIGNPTVTDAGGSPSLTEPVRGNAQTVTKCLSEATGASVWPIITGIF